MLLDRAARWLLPTLLITTSAAPNPLPGLFDTGVDGVGAVLADGAVDPHYALVFSADASFPGPTTFASNPIPSGYWVANSATSRWIAPAVNEGYPTGAPPHPAGLYTFRLTVDLTGFDPGTVEIHGTWAADNSGSILLNGSATGSTVGGFGSLIGFSIASGFVAGINTLDFVVANAAAGGANPVGLRVDGIAGTGTNAVSVLEGSDARSLALSAPFPNPTRNLSHVHFGLPRAASVRLVVCDVSGRAVRTLVDGVAPAGRVESSWDGRAADGTRVAAGVYFVDLRAEGRHESRPIVVLR